MPTIKELKSQAKAKGLKGYSKMKKNELLVLLSTPKPNGTPIPPPRTTSLPKRKKIGQGSFGTVYLMDNKWVMKEVSIQSNFYKKRVDTEITILKKIGCTKYTTCIISDKRTFYNPKKKIYYISMELVKGVSIGDFMYSQKKITLKQFNQISAHLYAGLEFIHKKGIAHKDITPNNIMIDPITLQAKFIDFGMSCDTPECLSSGNLKWMDQNALNLFKNKQPISLKDSQKSDIHSLTQVLDYLKNINVV